MTAIPPKPNRKPWQIAVSDSVALVLCVDGTLWAYDLLVKVAAWEQLPPIPIGRAPPKEPTMDPETGEDAPPPAKPKPKPPAKRLTPHPNVKAGDAPAT